MSQDERPQKPPQKQTPYRILQEFPGERHVRSDHSDVQITIPAYRTSFREVYQGTEGHARDVFEVCLREVTQGRCREVEEYRAAKERLARMRGDFEGLRLKAEQADLDHRKALTDNKLSGIALGQKLAKLKEAKAGALAAIREAESGEQEFAGHVEQLRRKASAALSELCGKVKERHVAEMQTATLILRDELAQAIAQPLDALLRTLYLRREVASSAEVWMQQYLDERPLPQPQPAPAEEQPAPKEREPVPA